VIPKLRIAIVGYGIAGISAAILLRRLGHDVFNFERAAVTGSGGAGLLLNSAALDVLGQLGLRSAVMARGAAVSRICGATLSGSKIIDLRYEDYFPGNHGLGIQRGAMLGLLHTADEQARHLRTAQITAADAEHGYLFDERRGRVGPFDLIVGADGVSSSIRTGLKELVRHDRTYRSSAIVCLVDDPNGTFGDRVLQYFSGSRHIAIWPVGSRASGAPRRISVSVNIPITQADSFRAPVVWRRHVEELCPAVVPLLNQPIGTGELLLFTYRDVALRQYHRGRVVLIGDAAHSMSPQLGQGASMALLDSQALAEALERNKDTATALAEFDRNRRVHASAYQRISRWVTPLFQSENRALTMLRDCAFYRASSVRYVKSSMLKTLSGHR
jgi:2-polyprenyl-6-methoxyphenol hydroxylase-like FAD-dependent oxidoreductase